MKLNLLPTNVSRATSAKPAIVASVLIGAASIAGAVLMVLSSRAELDAARTSAEALQPEYQATQTLQQNVTAANASLSLINGNVQLAQSMIAHNDKYPNLYNALRPYIPSFFRVTEMRATPAGAQGTTVQITGVIGSYQQYADLMLALLRIPAPYGPPVAVTRSGFTLNDMIVPALSEQDQTGRPRRPAEEPVPDDPLERLEFLINRASSAPTGYLSQGGFGSQSRTEPRLAREGESVITVTIVLPYNLQAPDPSASLAQYARGNAAGAAPAPGAAAAPGLAGGAGVPPAPPEGRGSPMPGMDQSPEDR